MTGRLSLALALAIAACAPSDATLQIVDARAVLPDGLLKRDYVRHYLRLTITDDTDLPFTTSHDFTLPAPRLVWAGVYVRAPGVWTASPARIEVVEQRERLPEVFHGGCDVVNIVADARTGETLGSWCNVDDRETVDGTPRRVPSYIPPHSPLR